MCLIEKKNTGVSKLNIEPYDEDEGTGELRYVQVSIGIFKLNSL